MSRVLPSRPSLEHLRHQARQRLHLMQQQRSSAKLSDAQHAIAREYGFASWPKLKAHVESLAPADDSGAAAALPESNGGGNGHAGSPVAAWEPPFNYAFARYSHRARQAVFFARFEAASAGMATIEAEHLLLGVIRAAQGTRGRGFEDLGLSLEGTRTAATQPRAAADTPLGMQMHIPFSDAARLSLRHAVEQADRLRDNDIRLAHLLLGTLMPPASTAANIVSACGLTADGLRSAIDNWLVEDPR